MANPLKDAVVGVITKARNKVKKVLKIDNDSLYNYSDKSSRESTIEYLMLYADGQRQDHVKKWRLYDAYYNNDHLAQHELRIYCQKKNIPWIPAIIPDPYIHVESQVDSEIPEFEFSGRDDDMDSQKAKMRQYVCQYVLDQNEMLMKINRNQRRLRKLGNEIWKVGFNYNVEMPGNIHGDIFVHDIDPANFINDPIALDIDDGEYHDYVYSIHRIKAARIFANELKKLGIEDITQIGSCEPVNTRIYTTENYERQHDTVQVAEHWFRQPQDGSDKYTYEVNGKEVTETVEWEAGDIACSIVINNTEIKYIPKYWMKTSKQNKMYPFAIGCTIPVENSFWDKSEIEPIKELVDAADRELAINILNDTFTANDIIIMSKNAMEEGSEPINEPGAIWKVNESALIKPTRLGGLSSQNGGLKDTINFIREIIKQTVGNFDVNMGDAPPGNIRTLGGLVQMKEQGNSRQNKKRAGTIAMWERVLKLIDYTAIEFYDDNRLIFIGAEEKDQIQPQQPPNQPWQEKPWEVSKPQPIPQQQQTPQIPGQPQPQQPQQNMDKTQGAIHFRYNSDYLKVFDDQTEQYYYPSIDYKVTVGNGITNSPAMTIEATEKLATMPVTMENKEIVKGLADLMKLPNRQVIKKSIDDHFQNQMSMPFLFKDMPQIRIMFADLAPDAQIQILQQMGIQSQGGLNNELTVESQKNQADIQLKQQQLQQPTPDAQLKQIQHQPSLEDIMSGLSPDELQHLQSNPDLMHKVHGIVHGG